jgi:hypothetical protein
MKQCPYCNQEFEKHAIYANHVRWCKANPKFELILKSTQDKIALTTTIKQCIKQSSLKLFHVKCSYCQTELQVKEHENLHPLKSKYFCSRSCANTHEVSDKHKLKTQQSILRFNIKNNTTRKCEQCGTPSPNKRYCDRCLNDRKEKKQQKLTFTAKRSTTAQIYRYACAFNFALNAYPDKFDFGLIEQHGWYRPANSKQPNLSGVSRDHMVSIRYGLDNGIPPEIISHPANCQLLRHNENQAKNAKCKITLAELQERILAWK